MPGLMNWPPSRGPNPHAHEWDVITSVSRKDLPAPKQREVAVAEKSMIESLQKGEMSDVQPPKRLLRRRRERKKPLLSGKWSMWYPVQAVASITLEQADQLVLACSLDGRTRHRDHLENWILYEPRTLWVDITYPLNRGVRLCVKPLVREAKACKACGEDHPVSKRVEMSPGYLLWTLAKEYERIYKEHEKYGVWGHGLDDLNFEGVYIKKDGVVDLWLGS